MPASARRTLVGFAAAALLASGALAAFFLLAPDREYDPDFDASVGRPAYDARQGPTVLYDHAHLSIHDPDRGYKPFLDLLANDGYVVRVLRQPVTAARLRDVAVFVVACPLGPSDTGDDPAFTAAEIDAIDQWVRGGGSLLLITDHWPFGPAARTLAERFGVDMAGGLVEDAQNFEPALGESHLVFSRQNGLLRDHPITLGRTQRENISRILSFTGQSLAGPEDTAVFLALADTAVDFPPSEPTVEKSGGDVRVSMEYGQPVSAAGRAQGIAMEVEKGRVVVLGEGGMLRAYHDPRGSPVGMNYPGYDNRQLALNIMHWLSRAEATTTQATSASQR